MQIIHFWQVILPYLFGILVLAGYSSGGIKGALLPLLALIVIAVYPTGEFRLSGDIINEWTWVVPALFSCALFYRLLKKRRIMAKTFRLNVVLEQHGMTLYTYQPPISTHGELDEALYFFANSKHIIFDREGQVAGRFLLADIKYKK